MEIPFVDGPEAAFVNVVSRKEGLVSNTEWEAMRPYMIMIHIDDWSEIKQTSYENCRYAGEKCNVAVDSIDEAVMKLDRIIKQIVGGRL